MMLVLSATNGPHSPRTKTASAHRSGSLLFDRCFIEELIRSGRSGEKAL